jgi:tetratricopeptide (TPR) repeat protein
MGINNKIKAIAIILVMAFSCHAFADSDLENGNKSFYANKRAEAKAAYQKAVLITKEKAEAHLMLSLLATLEGKETEAFTQFESFFKSSENPYPYLFSLWSTESVMGTSQKKSPERLNFFNQLAADPKANGTLKSMAYAALGDHFNASNQLAKSKENFAKMGALDVWSMVGEFENISESGFDKAFEPISRPEESATFTNKNGAKVKWFKMLGNRNDKWVDFTFHYFYENSIIYAQTFVNSLKDQEVVFRIGTSGSLKVWINDALALSESEERNNDLDTYQAKVKLNKGFNRILVQIGSSEINRSNFLARITDDFGNNISGLSYSAGFQSYTKSNATLPKVIPIFAESFFEEKVNSGKASVIDYLLLANAHLRNDKGYEARKALETAQKLAPNCSYLKIKQIEAYNRSGNETDAKITIEALKEKDPECLLALNLFYQEEMEKENFEAATKIVDKIELLFGSNEDIMIKRIGLASREKKQDLLVKLVEQAYQKYPENFGFVSLKVDVEKSMNKSFDAAISILKKYLKTNFSYEAQKAISDLYFGKGMSTEGLATFDKIVENAPYTPGYKFNLGKYYFGTRDYTKAESYYQQCINNAPDIFYFWSALAQNFNEKGNSAKAIEAYQRALELNPADFESREQLRKLQNKKEVFSYFPKLDVYEIVKKSPPPSSTPDDNSLVLLDEVQKVVYSGGTSEEKRIFVVKIMNEDGINRWKQYYIQHYAMQNFDVEKAEVVKANGSKVEGSSNGSEIVFTNLEVGDAIHVSYKLKSFNGGKLARHFWETFQFSHYMPFLTTRYSLMVEQGVTFNHKFSKEKIEPKVQKLDEFEMFTWEKLNQPSLPFEDKMPELSDIGNALYISTIPDWTFVSNWYYDLAASKSKGNLEVKEAVAKLFEGKTGLSEMQKARMIYESIVTNIKYLSVAFLQSGLIPQKASHTLNTRLGDCKDVSTLFVAMCREVGIQADLVLIATRNQGKYQMLLPTIDFNHCIARLSSGGKTYFIELTSDKLPFNTFYDNLKNANSLLINSEKSGQKAELVYLNPETRNLNMVLRKTDISLDGNDVKVKKTTLKTGVYASNMRENYRNLGQTDQLKEMQRAIAGDYNQTSIKSIQFKGLEGISDTVSYSYNFEAPDAVSEIGGLKLLPLPWSERSKATDFNFTDDRKFPIDLWNYESDGEEETIELNLPPKMALAELPANVQISNPVADYSLTYKQVPGKLLLSRKFRFKKDGIGIEEMKDFQLFYRKVVTADNKQIALKMGAAAGGGVKKAGDRK